MPTSPIRVGVAIPIRNFHSAKSRLAGALTESERSETTRRWAHTVVEAARPHAAFVVTDDDAVAEWAVAAGATAVVPGRTGLDVAARVGLRHIADAGFDVAVIAHADIPGATTFDHVISRHGEIVLVPDHRRDGTTVIALPCAIEFAFAYGPGSFGRHLRHASTSGHPLRTVEDTALSFDVDHPEDLAALS